MKILFDQCLADDLKKSLPGHEVVFSRQLNWAELSNGQLIDAAEAAGFDVMITSDKNLKYQQNLSKRCISIIVLGNNYWPEVQRHLAEIVTAVEVAKPNSFQEIPMLTRKEFLRRSANLKTIARVSSRMPVGLRPCRGSCNRSWPRVVKSLPARPVH